MLNADFYFCNTNDFYVGFASESADFKVIEKEKKLLDIIPADAPTEYNVLCKIQLFQDIQGQYYDYLHEDAASYRLRDDGKVEKVITTETGSNAKIVEPLKRVYSPYSMPFQDRKKSDTEIRYNS